MKRMVLATLLAAFLYAAPAQAVTKEYCAYSLRGGGTLAPDNDIKREWDRIEITTGANIVSSYAGQWYPGGTYLQVEWVFLRANGSAYRRYFGCWGSGGSYGDSVL